VFMFKNLDQRVRDYKEKSNFLTKVLTIVKMYETSEELQKKIKETIIDLNQVMFSEIKTVEPEDLAIGNLKSELLKRFQAKDTQGVFVNLVWLINQKYNKGITPFEQWLELKVTLLSYQELQKQRLQDLNNSGKDSPYLLQEKKDLIQQESVLSEIVAKLDPFAYERRGEEDIYTQDCEQAKQLLEKRIKALGKQGYRHFSIMQPQKESLVR